MKKYFQSIASKVKNVDFWSNQKTGIGAPDSRVNSTRFRGTSGIDRYILTALYRDDGIAKRIVNLIVNDALRGFIEAEAELLDELDRLDFKQKLIECASYARLYGGAAIVAFSDDGSDMEEPINFNRLKKIVKLVVYDRQDITWAEEDLNSNYYDEGFGEPSVYTITDSDTTEIKVHASRCYLLGGEITTRDVRRKNGGWDDSVLQSAYDSLLNYGAVKSSSAEVVQDYNQKVLSVNGLSNLISSGQLDRVQKRIRNLDLEISTAQVLVIDSENERYEKHSSSASGLADLWEKFQEDTSASNGIPLTKLFGTTAGGLNGNSESDNESWNNDVQAYRDDNLTPCIDWMVEMVSNQMMWLSKDRPVDYEWTFPSLDTPNDEDTAKVKLLTAQSDSIYVNMGSIDAKQLYALRYSTGIFQKDITIPEELLGLDDTIDLSGNEDLTEVKDPEDDEKQQLFKKISERL